MDIGIHLMSFNLSGGPGALRSHVRDTAEAAEAGGCTMFTCMDHYFQMEQFTRAEDPMLEGYTTLGYVAGRTETMTLGLLCTGVTYRYPGLLAKIVSTLDVLSGGRAMLGIGAAWYEREHLALGVPFPPVAERFERLEETLRIVRQMWSEDEGPFEGRHYRLAETINSPQPLPRPAIMVGGGDERKTLRLVARYADACNLFASPEADGPAQVAAKLDVLRRHCAHEGTDYDRIRKTVLYSAPVQPGAQAGQRFVELMAAYAAVGITEVHVMPMDADPVDFIRNLGEHVAPRLPRL